jgi:hypothetical protein
MQSVNGLQVAVAALISLLGSPSFRQREAAMHALSPLLPVALPHLEAAEQHPDPEVARRVQQLLMRHRRAEAEYLSSTLMPRGWKQHPWITLYRLGGSCTEDERSLRDWCLRTAMKTCPSNPPAWQAYREATRLYLFHQLRDRRLNSMEAQALLEELAEQERQWIREHGKSYGLSVPP